MAHYRQPAMQPTGQSTRPAESRLGRPPRDTTHWHMKVNDKLQCQPSILFLPFGIRTTPFQTANLQATNPRCAKYGTSSTVATTSSVSDLAHAGVASPLRPNQGTLQKYSAIPHQLSISTTNLNLAGPANGVRKRNRWLSGWMR